jgi:NADH-quinone oxidoreductase subunit L
MHMLPTELILLILALPLAGFLLPALIGKRYPRILAGGGSLLFMLIATLLSFLTAGAYFFSSGKIDGVFRAIIPFNYTWLSFGPGLSIDMGILLDPISVMMLVVVTFVSLMVHVYSLEYMKGQERFTAYFSFLGLFTFSMLGLVVSSNIFQMYIFWELVGVSSFLLIGFHFEKISARAAARKAFIVTRFADLGFLIGILVLSYYSGTLDFPTMISRLTEADSPALKAIIASSFLGISALSWGLILVFMGGAGKSAMFPLHIWLPDAMEGPTPVSALIHAATMVVAGVFLVARLFPVFSLSDPAALHVVEYIGLFSSLFAALIACTQTDIKRVLAYSTMSQIGYMMFALGVAGYGGEEGLGFTASMFHLFTHAGFKALLFLGAGAVIHYVHSNEMTDMGGLRKQMPLTHITFLIACLAISGVPPLAGFFSKEEILLACYHHDFAAYVLALATSGITAFYMFRLYFSIFWSKPTPGHPDNGHHGEGGFAMMLPLILLSLVTLGSGWIPFGEFVASDGKALFSEFHLSFSVLPIIMGAAGILTAALFYKNQNERPSRISAAMQGVYSTLRNKFYIDEVYLFITRKLLYGRLAAAAAWVDRNVVDGFVVFTGEATRNFSESIKGWQSGKLQQYAVYFLMAALLIVIMVLYIFNM